MGQHSQSIIPFSFYITFQLFSVLLFPLTTFLLALHLYYLAENIFPDTPWLSLNLPDFPL